MNESRVRSLLRRAFGEPAVPGYIGSQARQAVERSIREEPARRRNGALTATAFVLAIAVVAVLVAPRIWRQPISFFPQQLQQPSACAADPHVAEGAGPQPARVNAAMAYDPDTKQVVLFGGMAPGTSGSALDDTWVWDGAAWSQRVMSVHPDVREQAAMAYDAAHHRLVLFGGVDTDGTPYNDTWTWDGTAWRQEHPATVPPARFLPAVAYDDALGKVVMFGGWNPVVGMPAKLHDTWSWDGSDWTQVFTATVPSKRGSSVMDYDASTRKLVMFGGDTGNSTNETWTFDGTDWAMQHPSRVPVAREATEMARDDASGTLVLFGGEELEGNNFAGPGADTWTWNGTTWTERHPAHSPPARGVETLAGNMTYDAALGQVVLYGGTGDGGSALGDTWTWNGSDWRQVSTTTSCP
jgi:hypothetical protein